MDELVEKMARAIFAQSFHPYDAETGVVDEKWLEWDQDRERSQNQAQAALAAIRETHTIVPKEPTEAMIDAGAISRCGYATRSECADMKDCYRAMIEAAPTSIQEIDK